MILEPARPQISAEAFIKVTPLATQPVVYPWASPGGPATATHEYLSGSTTVSETIGYHHAGHELTFEAIISRIPTNEVATVRWDMGDGTIKYGRIVAHTYQVPAADILVTVAITDTRGHTVYAGRQMYLQVVAEDTVITRHIIMSSA